VAASSKGGGWGGKLSRGQRNHNNSNKIRLVREEDETSREQGKGRSKNRNKRNNGMGDVGKPTLVLGRGALTNCVVS